MPKLILPNSTTPEHLVYICFYYFVLQLYFLFAIILDYLKGTSLALIIIRTTLLVLANILSVCLISTDPGIKAIGDAVINLNEVSQFQK